MRYLQITLALGLMVGCGGDTVDGSGTERTTESNESLALMLNHQSDYQTTYNPDLIDSSGTNTVETRFRVPEGYERISAPTSTYGAFLRALPLKPHGSPTLRYDGTVKFDPGHRIQVAVIDLGVGKRDLQQCADAVIRLRAEYLYKQKRYEAIHFNFLSDGKPRYYTARADATYSRESFDRYLDYVYAYANTRSLYGELKSVEINDIQIGDVFIQTGNPYGHAVTVIDVATHRETGKRLFLPAQSHMPAQEIEVLVNPANRALSPWYEAQPGELETPSWLFEAGDLRRFPEE